MLKGNPGKRPINDAEPKPSKKRPNCPTWVDADAKSMWKRLIPMLSDMGVLTEVDGNAAARYCHS
ncbi:MAG: P27 family phage terminase small subunit, partial [Planctomycetes bacterium]|nr:P27 family phage terminase small subunit [Planctomycetota bacterium]